MKQRRIILVLIAAFALLATACGSDGGVEDQPEIAASADERIETLWVAPQLTDCVGAFPQTCMRIRRSENGRVELFYDSIQGFEHEAGMSYVLKVAITDVDDPPADGSSVNYRLVEVIESASEPATAGLDGTSWQLRGFSDTDLFDAIPDEVTITIKFEGDRVTGSAGCNNYMGTFTADGDQLSFGPLAGTKMLCPPDVMVHEDRFHAVMATVESAEAAFGERLVLKPATGLSLVFERG